IKAATGTTVLREKPVMAFIQLNSLYHPTRIESTMALRLIVVSLRLFPFFCPCSQGTSTLWKMRRGELHPWRPELTTRGQDRVLRNLGRKKVFFLAHPFRV